MNFPISVRDAFAYLPQEASHLATNAPRWAEVFTPIDHQGALDPSRPVVVGDRGTGKSFWSSVLVDSTIRNLVAGRYPRLRLDSVEGRLGFSDGGMTAKHPSKSDIQAIAKAGFDAEDLWRAVLLRLAPTGINPLSSACSDWLSAVKWIADDPSRRNDKFRELDQNLKESGKTYVLIFDALDVMADQWNDIRVQLAGLIKLALAVRALSSVRIKLFIRPDMADDRRMWEVGDASKLRHSEVYLTWKRRDLYGLLWTLLANTPNESGSKAGELFRSFCESEFGARFELQDESWRPALQLIEDENRQQSVFHALAGEYMGASPTKGDTYKWVTNHLADAAGFAAPRSFLLAMKEGAAKTKSRETALDKAGIEAGARIASRVRVQELSEDYRWMDAVLKVMEGLAVPLSQTDLIARWSQRETLAALRKLAADETQDRRFIPLGEVFNADDAKLAYDNLADELIRLKIFFRLNDGRINMPDLFRLQANVKRKGGMKPRT